MKLQKYNAYAWVKESEEPAPLGANAFRYFNKERYWLKEMNDVFVFTEQELIEILDEHHSAVMSNELFIKSLTQVK